MQRRRLLFVAGAMSLTSLAQARSVGAVGLPLRLGVDSALFDSGLASGLQRAFGRDTGIVVQLVPAAASSVLQALTGGEVDGALANVPDAEASLEQQGLLHDRQAIAIGEFVLVGPEPKVSRFEKANGVRTVPGKPGVVTSQRAQATHPALAASAVSTVGSVMFGGHDAAAALARIRDAAVNEPGRWQFLSADDGSGVHVAEQALWRSAGIAPVAPWYVALKRPRRLLAEAKARGAFALVERGVWDAQGGGPLALVADADARLVEAVHVMRAFQVNHPAGKIFVAWIAGGRGRAVVRRHAGYRPAAEPLDPTHPPRR